MIINPQVGQQVIRSRYPGFTEIGTIVEIRPSRMYPIYVKWEGRHRGGGPYSYKASELKLADLDPDALLKYQDQQRRQEHADKYL